MIINSLLSLIVERKAYSDFKNKFRRGNMEKDGKNACTLVDIVLLFRFLKIGWNSL